VKPFPVTGALRFAYISKIECQHPRQNLTRCVPIDTNSENYMYSELKTSFKQIRTNICYLQPLCSVQKEIPSIDVNTILESHTCLDIFVPFGMQLAAGEQANIWLQNISHDLSVDDNLLLKENVPRQCTGKISSSFQRIALLPLICDYNKCKKDIK